MAKLRPVHCRVQVVPDPDVTTSQGGIHLPDRLKERNKHGTVLAVGAGKYDAETGNWRYCQVKVGDRVMFDPRNLVKFKVDGDDCFIIDEHLILGVLEE